MAVGDHLLSGAHEEYAGCVTAAVLEHLSETPLVFGGMANTLAFRVTHEPLSNFELT